MATETRCILFDLDGTLVDTAPDMAAACNALREEEGLEPVAPATVRDHVSRGAVGVLTVGMPQTGAERFERWRRRFLELYRERVADQSRPFEGMGEVLAAIDAAELCWGVVTNKPGWLAEPLLAALGLRQRLCALVAGDTLSERKPHPQPLLHAAASCGTEPVACLYVGDDVRDVIASRAAGMRSVAALWGYIPPDETPERWNADLSLSAPRDLLRLIPSGR